MGPYIERCVSFQIMSNQLNLPQVDCTQVVETSRMINGNRMHLSSIPSLLAKGLNTYVNKVFMFFAFNVFALSLWGIVCRRMRKLFYLMNFRIRHVSKCGKSEGV